MVTETDYITRRRCKKSIASLIIYFMISILQASYLHNGHWNKNQPSSVENTKRTVTLADIVSKLSFSIKGSLNQNLLDHRYWQEYTKQFERKRRTATRKRTESKLKSLNPQHLSSTIDLSSKVDKMKISS